MNSDFINDRYLNIGFCNILFITYLANTKKYITAYFKFEKQISQYNI